MFLGRENLTLFMTVASAMLVAVVVVSPCIEAREPCKLWPSMYPEHSESKALSARQAIANNKDFFIAAWVRIYL